MKIAFITVDSHLDHKSWSGLKLNIYNTLKNISTDIHVLPTIPIYLKIFFKLKRNFYKFLGIKFDSERVISLSKIYSKILENKLRNLNPDLIFTCDSYSVSFVRTNKPIYIWTDATFQNYYSHYFKKFKIHKKTIKEGNLLDLLAFRKAKKIIFTSNWAKKNCISHYGIDKNKIEILPFGSNLKNKYLEKRITDNIIKKSKKKIFSFISVGVDWERKGMEFACKLIKKLNELGINAKLTIIGPKKIPDKYKNLKYVKFISFLDKNNSKNIDTIQKNFFNSHFHLLFSKAEAFGVVFAEANSLGLFNFCFDVGGVSGAIKNDKNGYKFKKNATATYVAKVLRSKYLKKKNYIKYSKSSYYFQQKNLDWIQISKKLKSYLI